MIKGAQKQIIVVKTSDSVVFEEAYFVLRPKTSSHSLDMLSEANKIIEGCGINQKKKKRFSAKAIILSTCIFFGGAAGGALVTVFFSLL